MDVCKLSICEGVSFWDYTSEPGEFANISFLNSEFEWQRRVRKYLFVQLNEGEIKGKVQRQSFYNFPRARCTSCQPIFRVSRIRCAQCGLDILSGFVGGSFPAPASANKGAAPNPILTGSLPTYNGDERGATRHDDGASIVTYFRDKAGIEGVDAVLSSHWVCALWITHQEHKKSANPHQAAESSVEIFRSEDRSPAHRPSWVKAPYRLQRQVAGFGRPNHS